MNDKNKRLWENSLDLLDEEIIGESAKTLYKKSLSDTDSDELIVVEEQKKNNRFIFVVAACVVALIGVVTMVSVMLLNGGIGVQPTDSTDSDSSFSESSEQISTNKTDEDIYNKYGHIKYTCDLSAFPVDDTRIWFGKIILIEDGRMLVSPGLDKGKTEFGEVVWLIDDYAYTYSVGQVVTYKYRDVKAPEKEGYPLSIIALLVYME